MPRYPLVGYVGAENPQKAMITIRLGFSKSVKISIDWLRGIFSNQIELSKYFDCRSICFASWREHSSQNFTHYFILICAFWYYDFGLKVLRLRYELEKGIWHISLRKNRAEEVCGVFQDHRLVRTGNLPYSLFKEPSERPSNT